MVISRQLAVTFGIGVVVIAAAVAGIFYIQRGSHIELKGSVLKTRTAPLDENSSVAVVDFRFVNPSNFPFVVRSVDVTVEGSDGKTHEGTPVSELDAKRLFQYYPILGQKFNDTLLIRDKIGARQSQDRMIAARFEIPVQQLEARKQLTIRIEDVDGPVSEVREK